MLDNRDVELLNISSPSLKESLNNLVKSVIEVITQKGLLTRISDDELYLIVDEAITNAIEHGNKWDPEKKVYVTVSVRQGHLKIGVRDEGEGFAIGECLDETVEPETLALRGRGIKIIKQFCNPKWNKSGNYIELLIDLA